MVAHISGTYGVDLVKGVTDGSDASVGQVGEYVESVVLAGSAVSLATGVVKDITSITLTAGDWDVSGLVVIVPAVTTSTTNYTGFVNNVSATLPTLDQRLFTVNEPPTVHAASCSSGGNTKRYSLLTTTTIYLSVYSVFTVSTTGAYGKISARRIR